jgi:hypothetical protein
MFRMSLVSLAFAFFLVNAVGCSDSEPKKVDENPFKARQEQKEKDQGKLMMPRGIKPKESAKDRP